MNTAASDNTHTRASKKCKVQSAVYLRILHGEYSMKPVNEPRDTKHVPTGSRRWRFCENDTYRGAQAFTTGANQAHRCVWRLLTNLLSGDDGFCGPRTAGGGAGMRGEEIG